MQTSDPAPSADQMLEVRVAYAHKLLTQGQLLQSVACFRSLLAQHPFHLGSLQGAVEASLQVERWDWALDLTRRIRQALQSKTEPDLAAVQLQASVDEIICLLFLGEYQSADNVISSDSALYYGELYIAAKHLISAAHQPLTTKQIPLTAQLESAFSQLLSRIGHGCQAALRLGVWDGGVFAATLMAAQAKAGIWQHRESWLKLLELLSHRDDLDFADAMFWSMALGPSDATHARIAVRYAAAVRGNTPPSNKQQCTTTQPHTHNRPLRVGYLSARFATHATAVLLHKLPAAHDRRRVEVYGYAVETDQDSPLLKATREGCDHFCTLTEDPTLIANAIARDKIDVLVALVDFNNRALLQACAMQPSPVTVHYMSFNGSLGGLCNYRLTDGAAQPDAKLPLESWLQLSGTCFVYSPGAPSRRLSRAAADIPSDAIVLCAFNAAYKLSASVCRAWAALLHAEPRAILWLLATHSMVKPQLLNWFASSGIGAERLRFLKPMEHENYLAHCALADLYVDAWDCGGHTTLLDMLSVGVPPIVLQGSRYSNRVGDRILNAVNLGEWVAHSPQEYLDKALELMRSVPLRMMLRQRLLAKRKHLQPFDIAAQARRLEDAYLAAYDRHARGLPPADIDIA
jgi:predicted O-linked N-acetylglucosamine transferase (SPINDLY family)